MSTALETLESRVDTLLNQGQYSAARVIVNNFYEHSLIDELDYQYLLKKINLHEEWFR